MRAYFFRLMVELQKLDIWPVKWRSRMLGLDRSTNILAGSDFVQGALTIGWGSFIASGCHLDAKGGISIGAQVHLGPRVTIVTASHPIGSTERRCGTTYYEPVEIGDGAWIGAGATILPGVSIGKGCVIAAGSVVTEDTIPDSLYAGVPARQKRELPISI